MMIGFASRFCGLLLWLWVVHGEPDFAPEDQAVFEIIDLLGRHEEHLLDFSERLQINKETKEKVVRRFEITDPRITITCETCLVKQNLVFICLT